MVLLITAPLDTLKHRSSSALSWLCKACNKTCARCRVITAEAENVARLAHSVPTSPLLQQCKTSPYLTEQHAQRVSRDGFVFCRLRCGRGICQCCVLEASWQCRHAVSNGLQVCLLLVRIASKTRHATRRGMGADIVTRSRGHITSVSTVDSSCALAKSRTDRCRRRHSCDGSQACQVGGIVSAEHDNSCPPCRWVYCSADAVIRRLQGGKCDEICRSMQQHAARSSRRTSFCEKNVRKMSTEAAVQHMMVIRPQAHLRGNNGSISGRQPARWHGEAIKFGTGTMCSNHH